MDQWSRQSMSGSRLPVDHSPAAFREGRAEAGSPDLNANGASSLAQVNAASDSIPTTFSRSPIPSLTIPVKKDFESIKAACLAEDQLFQDPEFPANDTALYFSRQSPHPIVWKRPWELLEERGLQPMLFADEATHFRVKQGELGDLWVVIAAACLFENIPLLQHVVPFSQNFRKDSYAGVFCFRFWRYGQWQEVVIDDRLPTINGDLVFIQSSSPVEFWAALLEKAYAKLLGSYEALKSGLLTDALHDFTGGLVEVFNFEEEKPTQDDFTNVMFKALERQSLVGCIINSHTHPNRSAPVLSNGLVTGRTYNVTDLREIRVVSNKDEEPISLIRLRDPFGAKVNWNGAWSESSSEWTTVPAQDRQKMGLVCRDHAEFWMDMKQFLHHFDLVSACHLRPDCPQSQPSRYWVVKSSSGFWKAGLSAGGRPALKDTHWINPQYHIILKDTDDDDGALCSILVQLEQKDRRRLKQRGMKQIDMGFVLYQRPKDVPLPLPKYFFDQHQFVARCDYFTNAHQVIKRFALPPGEYVLMPCTYEGQTEAEYLLSVFTENEQKFKFVDDPIEENAPPPQLSDQSVREKELHFQKYFYEIAGEDMEVNAFQFRQVLNMGLKTGRNFKDISMDACHSMLSLVDVSSSGKLGYHEFIYLWNIIKSWKKTFYQHAKSNTSAIDAHDLRSVILSLGYRLNSTFLSKLISRFSNDNYEIELDSFIMCMVKILTLFNVFRKHQKNGKAVFTLDQWLDLALVL